MDTAKPGFGCMGPAGEALWQPVVLQDKDASHKS